MDNKPKHFLLALASLLLCSLFYLLVYYLKAKFIYVFILAPVLCIYFSYTAFEKIAGRLHWLAVVYTVLVNICLTFLLDSYLFALQYQNLPAYSNYSLASLVRSTLGLLFQADSYLLFFTAIFASLILLLLGLRIGLAKLSPTLDAEDKAEAPSLARLEALAREDFDDVEYREYLESLEKQGIEIPQEYYDKLNYQSDKSKG